jgi:hypothetical protein
MPIYLKFGGEHLNSAFSNVDSDFIKLMNACDDSLLKVEFTVKHDINNIGGAFIKLGEGFGDLSKAGVKIDTAFLKLAIGSATGGAGAGKVAQADFLALDTTLKTSSTDLKILGSDFVKLDTAPDLLTLKLKEVVVSGDFLKVGADMSDASGAFLKLGTDLVALGSGENGNSPQLNEALKILGDFEQKISPPSMPWRLTGTSSAGILPTWPVAVTTAMAEAARPRRCLRPARATRPPACLARIFCSSSTISCCSIRPWAGPHLTLRRRSRRLHSRPESIRVTRVTRAIFLVPRAATTKA